MLIHDVIVVVVVDADARLSVVDIDVDVGAVGHVPRTFVVAGNNFDLVFVILLLLKDMLGHIMH